MCKVASKLYIFVLSLSISVDAIINKLVLPHGDVCVNMCVFNTLVLFCNCRISLSRH